MEEKRRERRGSEVSGGKKKIIGESDCGGSEEEKVKCM